MSTPVKRKNYFKKDIMVGQIQATIEFHHACLESGADFNIGTLVAFMKTKDLIPTSVEQQLTGTGAKTKRIVGADGKRHVAPELQCMAMTGNHCRCRNSRLTGFDPTGESWKVCKIHKDNGAKFSCNDEIIKRLFAEQTDGSTGFQAFPEEPPTSPTLDEARDFFAQAVANGEGAQGTRSDSDATMLGEEEIEQLQTKLAKAKQRRSRSPARRKKTKEDPFSEF